MSRYPEQLKALHRAIVHGEQDNAISLLKTARHNAFPPQSRIAVYADGYVIRLEEATASDYPALKHFMGEEAFKHMVHDYVTNTPSLFWDLNCYPAGMADYMENHSNNAAANALARLESSIASVFWASESPALEAAQLQPMDEEQLGKSRFRLRTASALLRFDYAANVYLTAFRNNAPLSQLAEGDEYLLVIRHHNEVQRLELEKNEYQLLHAIQQGFRFNDALETINQPEQLAEQLSAYLQRWLENGIFTSIS